MSRRAHGVVFSQVLNARPAASTAAVQSALEADAEVPTAAEVVVLNTSNVALSLAGVFCPSMKSGVNGGMFEVSQLVALGN